MANSTETFQGSENGAPSATATDLPDQKANRKAEVQKVRPLTPQSEPSGSGRSGPASRRKSRPKAALSKVKATVEILTKEQRHEAGKALRVKCLRTSHGEIVLGQGNKRDIVELIEAQNKDRLQNLVPIRHGRMASVSFRILSRDGGSAGLRSRRHANQRHNRSGLRRLSSDEFRRIRHARAKYRLRYQRFRRDPARTLRMGSETARRKLRDRSPMARFPGRSGKRNGGPDRCLISRVDERAREYRRP